MFEDNWPNTDVCYCVLRLLHEMMKGCVVVVMSLNRLSSAYKLDLFLCLWHCQVFLERKTLFKLVFVMANFHQSILTNYSNFHSVFAFSSCMGLNWFTLPPKTNLITLRKIHVAALLKIYFWGDTSNPSKRMIICAAI